MRTLDHWTRIPILFAVIGGLATTPNAQQVTLTYQIEANNFLNSSQNPPQPPTSTSVSGTYTITFDVSTGQLGIVPDAVLGLDITKANGAVIDFDETNSGADVTPIAPNQVHIIIGGTVSSIGGMTGLSDDFRVKFNVSEFDYQVTSIVDDLSFITSVDPFFRAESTTVTLLQAWSSYCTAGTSASGCQATLAAAGTASATATSGFTLSASSVEGAKDGLFFFGTSGRQANPWGNGTSFQCVVPPVRRAGVQAGSGTNGLCDGSFSQDLNALWCPSCPGSSKNPGAGSTVQAQLWYRDPLSTSNQTTSLSDAMEFFVAP